jgi:hypothetical protein
MENGNEKPATTRKCTMGTTSSLSKLEDASTSLKAGLAVISLLRMRPVCEYRMIRGVGSSPIHKHHLHRNNAYYQLQKQYTTIARTIGKDPSYLSLPPQILTDPY